jgi:hypothetical protein
MLKHTCKFVYIRSYISPEVRPSGCLLVSSVQGQSLCLHGQYEQLTGKLCNV